MVQRPTRTPGFMYFFETASISGSGIEMGFPRASHQLNITPPFYFCILPKSKVKFIFCDKPWSSDGYTNLIRVLEEFASHKLKQKKARKYKITAIMLSYASLRRKYTEMRLTRLTVHREIAHVSQEPMEPTHMLLKLVLAGETAIPKAVSAHVYLVGWVPTARYDTATVDWKEADDLAEHEIWAMREAQVLRIDSIGEFMRVNAAPLPHPKNLGEVITTSSS